MAQRKTHKYAKEIFILKQAIKGLIDNKLNPTIPIKDNNKNTVSYIYLKPRGLSDNLFRIEIKELEI